MRIAIMGTGGVGGLLRGAPAGRRPAGPYRGGTAENSVSAPITASPTYSATATALRALSEKSVHIRALTTPESKISILIDGPYTELAVTTLHSVYGRDKQ